MDNTPKPEMMTNLDVLIEAIKDSTIEPDNLTGDHFSTSFDIEAENGWAVDGTVDGRENNDREYTEDGLGYVNVSNPSTVTGLKFKVYDSEGNVVLLRKEEFDKVHEALCGIVE